MRGKLLNSLLAKLRDDDKVAKLFDISFISLPLPFVPLLLLLLLLLNNDELDDDIDLFGRPRRKIYSIFFSIHCVDA